MHKAGWENYGAIVRLLLQHGADASVPGHGGNTLLHMASWNGDAETTRTTATTTVEEQALESASLEALLLPGSNEAWHAANLSFDKAHNATRLLLRLD